MRGYCIQERNLLRENSVLREEYKAPAKSRTRTSGGGSTCMDVETELVIGRPGIFILEL